MMKSITTGDPEAYVASMSGLTEEAVPASLRLAGHGDSDGLAELRWLSRDERERAAQPFDEFAAGFQRWLAAALTSGTWRVAVGVAHSGDLVGCMYLHLVEKVPVPGDAQRGWGYVTHAYVREGERGRGIGAALLEMLVAEARRLNLEFLLVWPSGEAVTFYQRAGFLSPEQERLHLPGDEPSFILHLPRGGAGEV